MGCFCSFPAVRTAPVKYFDYHYTLSLPPVNRFLLVSLPSSQLCSTIYWQSCDWENENVKKAQCWENMKKGEAVASLARLSMKASANWDVSDIAERKD